MLFSRELLPIYLNDHLAGATAGCELARRAAGANKGTEMGDFLEQIAAQTEAHRAKLEEVMARLGVAHDPLKVATGWLAEKAGRLKLNGRLLDYSPLSRVLELEGLIIAVQGRESLWRTLWLAAPDIPRIAEIDFAARVEESEQHLAALKEHHAEAVEMMLAAR